MGSNRRYGSPGERAELRRGREAMISPDGRRRAGHCWVTTAAAAGFDDPDAPGLTAEWARGRNDMWYARVVYMPMRAPSSTSGSPTPDSLRPDPMPADHPHHAEPHPGGWGQLAPQRGSRQRILNERWPLHDRQGFHARGIPDQPHPISVRARIVWEHDGEEWITGRATRWTYTSVLVAFADPRCPPTTSSGRDAQTQRQDCCA